MSKAILSVLLLSAVFCLAASRAHAQGTYLYSQLMYDDSSGEMIGYSSTEIDYYCAADYNAYVEGYLYDDGSGLLVDYGSEEGYSIAAVFTAASANVDDDYTLNSYHDVIATYYYQEIQKSPEGCYPCDGCNNDCYYYYENWYWYDPFGFSFASTGYYGSSWYLYGFGPPTEVEYQQEQYLGETSDTLQASTHVILNNVGIFERGALFESFNIANLSLHGSTHYADTCGSNTLNPFEIRVHFTLPPGASLEHDRCTADGYDDNPQWEVVGTTTCTLENGQKGRLVFSAYAETTSDSNPKINVTVGASDRNGHNIDVHGTINLTCGQ